MLDVFLFVCLSITIVIKCNTVENGEVPEMYVNLFLLQF